MAAETALSVITDAFIKIKVYAPGVTLSAADSAWGLTTLNDMLDEWSNETLTCFANLEQTFPLVAGKNSYTIGTGGDINAVRPLSILTGQGAAYLVDTNQNRYPINVIEQDQWNQIGLLTETSQLPGTMFYDPQYPLGIINIFPTPAAAYVAHFDARLQLANMANLNASFSLPPGYMSAIKNNLAVRLWPDYKQGTPEQWRLHLAAESKAGIKRTNIRQSPATYDSAVVSKAQSTYNIYSDSTNRGGG